jgi:hypothetical protein
LVGASVGVSDGGLDGMVDGLMVGVVVGTSDGSLARQPYCVSWLQYDTALQLSRVRRLSQRTGRYRNMRLSEGSSVGVAVGTADGASDGVAVGTLVGRSVGSFVPSVRAAGVALGRQPSCVSYMQ